MRIAKLIVTCFTIVISSLLQAQDVDPVQVVQRQLDTYNAQDLEGFAGVFAEDAEVFVNLGDSIPSIVGRAAIKERYSKLFAANPDNKSTLIGRMVQGNYVIDHELITGREKKLRLIAIYEVEEGLIKRCWFAR